MMIRNLAKKGMVLIILLGSFFLCTVALAAWKDVARVSVDTITSDSNGPSSDSCLSSDGRFVAFTSLATDLVALDTNSSSDVFVRDMGTRTTTRVSVSSTDGQGNNSSLAPSISADGRYVAFESTASNLVPGDGNFSSDIFVRDRSAGTTTRVSISSTGVEGNADSLNPSISADGRYVAFYSHATNLVAGDTDSVRDVFVHDRTLGTTTRVSLSSTGIEPDAGCLDPTISADGRYIAFYSAATNLVSGDTNGERDAFVHDRLMGTTTRVSVSSAGVQGDLGTYSAVISADGRFVVFNSSATNLVAGDTNGKRDIFLHDRTTGSTTRVSVSSGGVEGNGHCDYPHIMPDGHYIVFSSESSNLVVGDTNFRKDVFVHDRITGLIFRVSVSTAGVEGNGLSSYGFISADGRYVTYYSGSTNLVTGDGNGTNDVFLYDFLGGDSSSPSYASGLGGGGGGGGGCFISTTVE